MREPATKRVYAFFDGQNLFHKAKHAFGSAYPDYDPLALARAICIQQSWQLDQVRFYTGIPDVNRDPLWHKFWTGKTAAMGRQGVVCYTRRLAYRTQTFVCPTCGPITAAVKQEKGIDTRLAIDVVRFARQNAYDVALLFTQDQDLSEAADEVREVAKAENRWIKVASAFPDPNTAVAGTDPCPCGSNKPYGRCCRIHYRGVNKTDWIRIERTTYSACIDPQDYR